LRRGKESPRSPVKEKRGRMIGRRGALRSKTNPPPREKRGWRRKKTGESAGRDSREGEKKKKGTVEDSSTLNVTVRSRGGGPNQLYARDEKAGEKKKGIVI